MLCGVVVACGVAIGGTPVEVDALPTLGVLPTEFGVLSLLICDVS